MAVRLTATKAAVLGLNFYTLFAEQSPVNNKIQDRLPTNNQLEPLHTLIHVNNTNGCSRIINETPYINSRE